MTLHVVIHLSPRAAGIAKHCRVFAMADRLKIQVTHLRKG